MTGGQDAEDPLEERLWSQVHISRDGRRNPWNAATEAEIVAHLVSSRAPKRDARAVEQKAVPAVRLALGGPMGLDFLLSDLRVLKAEPDLALSEDLALALEHISWLQTFFRASGHDRRRSVIESSLREAGAASAISPPPLISPAVPNAITGIIPAPPHLAAPRGPSVAQFDNALAEMSEVVRRARNRIPSGGGRKPHSRTVLFVAGEAARFQAVTGRVPPLTRSHGNATSPFAKYIELLCRAIGANISPSDVLNGVRAFLDAPKIKTRRVSR